MNKPPAREQASLQNYLENRQCLCETEAAFAYHKEDLVTLRPGRDHSFVDAFVEHLLKTFPCRPLKVCSGCPLPLIDSSSSQWTKADVLQALFCSKVTKPNLRPSNFPQNHPSSSFPTPYHPSPIHIPAEPFFPARKPPRKRPTPKCATSRAGASTPL